MRAYHNTRKSDWRTPFGAVPAGTEVTVSLDVWDDPGASCSCRIWVDGDGETVLPMEKLEQDISVQWSLIHQLCTDMQI